MRGRALGVFSASALVVAGVVALPAPASAVTKTISCGQTIKGHIKAANDIGPCTDGDALKINTAGTTLDLDGHSVRCDNENNLTRKQQVGIHLVGVSGATVKNGTVFNCDAGVAIDGGGHNTVTGITARDNVAHVLLTGGVDPDDPVTTPCDFGDGIVANNSNGNHIIHNVAYNNGPFSGISLVGTSRANEVAANHVYDNTVPNELPSGESGPCGPFQASGPGEGRRNQDIGIRIEGPGATGNTISHNLVTGNQLNGITIHGYVCLNGAGPTPGPGLAPRGVDNSGNLIEGNTVSGNGFADVAAGELQDGIAVLRQGPLGTITCASSGNTIRGNHSTGNARDGIFVSATGDNSIESNTTIEHNVVDNNGRDGIRLSPPFTVCPLGAGNSGPPNFTCNVARENRNGANGNTITGNTGRDNHTDLVNFPLGYDGFDGNPDCDDNDWVANIFSTVNQACVAANGGTGTVIP